MCVCVTVFFGKMCNGFVTRVYQSKSPLYQIKERTMSSITLQDMIRSAAQNVTFLDTTLSHIVHSYRSIREDELLCDERMDDFVLPAPMLPLTVVNHDTRLLAFESREATTLLCLRPPTAACRKRAREEMEAVSDTEYNYVSPRAPRKNEEWLSWINWDHVAS